MSRLVSASSLAVAALADPKCCWSSSGNDCADFPPDKSGSYPGLCNTDFSVQCTSDGDCTAPPTPAPTPAPPTPATTPAPVQEIVGYWDKTWGPVSAPQGANLGIAFNGWNDPEKALADSGNVKSSLVGEKWIDAGGGNENGRWNATLLEKWESQINSSAFGDWAGIVFDVEECYEIGLAQGFAAVLKAAKAADLKTMVTVSHSAPYKCDDAKELMQFFFTSEDCDYLSPQLYPEDGNYFVETYNVDIKWADWAGARPKFLPSLFESSLEDAYSKTHEYFKPLGIVPVGYIVWPDVPIPAPTPPTPTPPPSPAPSPPPSPSGDRRVSWWWNGDSEADAADLLEFVKAHTNIVSSVFMKCGVNLAPEGNFVGDLSAACAMAAPELIKLGVQPELWLGESNNLTAHHLMFDRADDVAETLVSLGQKYELSGMNIDLEPYGDGWQSTPQDALLFADFLNKIKPRLNDAGMRLTVDVASTGWCPMIGNLAVLGDAADRILDMSTYNAGSYSQWLSWFTPMTQAAPQGQIGVGLGCWVDSKTSGSWAITAESAEQRICSIMNESLVEVDMFRVLPSANWPEDFWIPQLEKFMAGGSCEPVLPENECPQGFPSPNADGCCEAHWAADCALDCAKQRCEEYKQWEWQDLDYTSRPYTCCPASASKNAIVI